MEHAARESSNKPPLGIAPKELHDKERAMSLCLAIGRFLEADTEVPEEWLHELGELCGY